MQPRDFDRIFEAMPADARASVRGRVLGGIASDARLRRARLLTWKAACAYVAASIAASGVAYASSSALPGEPLYAVKLAVEEAAIASAPSSALRGALQERVAVRRADELAELAAEGPERPAVREAVGRFEDAATRALSIPDAPKAKQAEEKLREHVDRVPGAAKARAKRALATAQHGASSGKKKAGTSGNGKAKGSSGSKRSSRTGGNGGGKSNPKK